MENGPITDVSADVLLVHLGADEEGPGGRGGEGQLELQLEEVAGVELGVPLLVGQGHRRRVQLAPLGRPRLNESKEWVSISCVSKLRLTNRLGHISVDS